MIQRLPVNCLIQLVITHAGLGRRNICILSHSIFLEGTMALALLLRKTLVVYKQPPELVHAELDLETVTDSVPAFTQTQHNFFKDSFIYLSI